MEPSDSFDVLCKFAEFYYLQRSLTQEEISTLRDFYDKRLRPTQKQHAHSEKLLQAIKEASDRAGQHLLESVQAASSLDELRPAALPSPPYTDNQLVVAQIADRLANLVQTEVGKCFEKNFGALRQQLQNALSSLDGAHSAIPHPASTVQAAEAPSPALA
ncbi:MAG: hypothetical protein LBI68_01240 [Azoarcus sp.]|jgi:hypothetical protein|nr:hypothetical protein [Azoarcus sp.]